MDILEGAAVKTQSGADQLNGVQQDMMTIKNETVSLEAVISELAIIDSILPVACCVLSASFLTSSATTANPLPASPANQAVSEVNRTVAHLQERTDGLKMLISKFNVSGLQYH